MLVGWCASGVCAPGWLDAWPVVLAGLGTPSPAVWPRLFSSPNRATCLPGFREEIVHVLQSTTPEDMERNVEQLAAWCRTWRPAS